MSAYKATVKQGDIAATILIKEIGNGKHLIVIWRCMPTKIEFPIKHFNKLLADRKFYDSKDRGSGIYDDTKRQVIKISSLEEMSKINLKKLCENGYHVMFKRSSSRAFIYRRSGVEELIKYAKEVPNITFERAWDVAKKMIMEAPQKLAWRISM